MHSKTFAFLTASCLALMAASGALAAEHGGQGPGNGDSQSLSAPLVDENGQAVDADGNAVAFEDLPAITSVDTSIAAPLVDENGQAVDADGNAVAFEDLPAVTSVDTSIAAPLVDENGQAVDADGNAIALEDLPAPHTLVDWLAQQDFFGLLSE
jgi:hypothetical protein